MYYVRSLVQKTGERAEASGHGCLAWHDGQSDRSVMFLCFGCIAEVSHSEEQIREIAIGLERSVVRDPKSVNNDDPDLHALLPEGFVE